MDFDFASEGKNPCGANFDFEVQKSPVVGILTFGLSLKKKILVAGILTLNKKKSLWWEF